MKRIARAAKLGLVGLVAAAACAHQPERLAYVPELPRHVPDAWYQVGLGEVNSEPEQGVTLELPAGEALRRALTLRLRGTRPSATLHVDGVQAMLTKVGHWQQLGLRGAFTLEQEGASKRLVLEQSINFQTLDAAEVSRVYGRLVADMCDRLLAHPEALAFLGARPALHAQRYALTSRRGDMGPVLPMEPSNSGVHAAGRVHWGHIERTSSAQLGMIGGGTRGVYADFLARTINLRYGLGLRVGGGIMGLDLGDRENPLIGGRLHLGTEFGLFTAVSDRSGSIMPGLDVVIAPQITGTLLLGGTAYGKQRTLTAIEAGVAPRLEIPLGRNLGVSGGVFAGAARAAIKGPKPIRGNSEWDVVVHPFGNLFLQTSHSRVLFGLSFSPMMQQVRQLKGRENALVQKSPIFTLTYEDRVGRGLARPVALDATNTNLAALPVNPFRLERPAPIAARAAALPRRPGKSAKPMVVAQAAESPAVEPVPLRAPAAQVAAAPVVQAVQLAAPVAAALPPAVQAVPLAPQVVQSIPQLVQSIPQVVQSVPQVVQSIPVVVAPAPAAVVPPVAPVIQMAGERLPQPVLVTPAAPVTAVAVSPITPSAASQPLSSEVRPAAARPERWVVLFPELEGEIEPEAAEVIRSAAVDVLTRAGLTVVDAEQMDQILLVLALEEIRGPDLPNVGSAAGADKTLLTNVRVDDSGRGVHLSLQVFDRASGQSNTYFLATPRAEMLGMLRERLADMTGARSTP